MLSKILVVALIGLIAQAHSACINCGLGAGKDVCTHHCSQMVVRPVKLPKVDISSLCKPRVICKEVSGITPFKPIGDLCCCNHAIVTPAKVPKSPCALCNPPKPVTSPCGAPAPSCSLASSSCPFAAPSVSEEYSHQYDSSYHYDQSHHYDHSSGTVTVIEEEPAYVANAPSSASTYTLHDGSSTSDSSSSDSSSGSHSHYILPSGQYAPVLNPADPVSLALAYKMQNSINKICEDKLCFGFRKMPKEMCVCKPVKQIFPEENLHGLNGDIVELKPVAITSTKTIDEEALEALMQAEEEEQQELAEGKHVKKLTYDEIGFGPAIVKETPYIEVHGTVNTGSIGSRTTCNVPCNDGYVPGKVIVEPLKKHHVCFEAIEDDSSASADDDDDDDDDDEDDDVSISDYVGPVPYPTLKRYRSTSSSCSRSSAHHHSTIIEKLRCH